jgi:hypothetical protein
MVRESGRHVNASCAVDALERIEETIWGRDAAPSAVALPDADIVDSHKTFLCFAAAFAAICKSWAEASAAVRLARRLAIGISPMHGSDTVASTVAVLSLWRCGWDIEIRLDDDPAHLGFSLASRLAIAGHRFEAGGQRALAESRLGRKEASYQDITLPTIKLTNCASQPRRRA